MSISTILPPWRSPRSAAEEAKAYKLAPRLKLRHGTTFDVAVGVDLAVPSVQQRVLMYCPTAMVPVCSHGSCMRTMRSSDSFVLGHYHGGNYPEQVSCWRDIILVRTSRVNTIIRIAGIHKRPTTPVIAIPRGSLAMIIQLRQSEATNRGQVHERSASQRRTLSRTASQTAIIGDGMQMFNCEALQRFAVY